MSKHHRLVVALVSLAMFVLVTGAEAATINVPGGYATIQAAINAAANNDEVIVAASGGPYVENIVFDGTKTITVKTTDGAVIDGNASGSVVQFVVGDSSTLDGFSLINGSGTDRGDGKLCGGGIYCLTSSPTINNCTISGNITNAGGGIFCNNSSPTITGCLVNDNTADISCGGGIYCYKNSSPSITNCSFTGNSAYYGGGGIRCRASSPTITNCTISGNMVSFKGGGIFCTNSSSPMVVNSILWGDKVGGIPNEIDLNASSIDITYSDIQGGWGTPEEMEANHNIDKDPIFVDPRSALDALTSEGDYHLRASSPCIDAGDPASAPPDFPADDIDGENRPNGSGYDMGAYEFWAKLAINILLNQSSFIPGDTLTATAYITNDDTPDNVNTKIAIQLPGGGLISIYNIPSITIPANADIMVPLSKLEYTFTGNEPGGKYFVGGRLLEPIFGNHFSTDIEPFTFTP
jgi:nitrous oxidase accessory protein NosD